MMHTRVTDLARVLLRAADIAEQDLIDLEKEAACQPDASRGLPETIAVYRLLRWLSDGANEIAKEDEQPPR